MAVQKSKRRSKRVTKRRVKRTPKKSKRVTKRRVKRTPKKSKRVTKRRVKRTPKKSKRVTKRRVKRTPKKSKRVTKRRVKRTPKKSKRVTKRRVKRTPKKSKRVTKRRVKRTPKKSNSNRRSGLKGIKLKKGELEGYKLSDPTLSRRRTLGGHVYEKGYLPVMKRVNVLSVLLRNKSPNLSKNAESDKNWLMKRQKQGGSESRWVPRKVDGTGFFR
jgi:hypothetical protein